MNDSIDTKALKLSVLVPSYGRGQRLQRLLHRLNAQSLPAKHFEVIVVDDGTPDPIAVEATEFSYELVLLRQANGGPASARNAGLERCRAPLVLILNDDTVPADDLLESHLRAHAEVPAKHAVLGSFHFTDEACRHPFVRLLDQSNLLFSFEGLKHGHVYNWGYFWTCNISLPVAALREVGGFDSETFKEAIVEDVELGYRLQKRGWKIVYREDCHSEHDHVLTLESYLARAVKLGRNLTRMWRKHGDPRIVWRATEDAATRSLSTSVGRFEMMRRVSEGFKTAFEHIDVEYHDCEMPDSLKEESLRLIRELNIAYFHRGMHIENTGIDPLNVIESGAPPGSPTSIVIVSYNAMDMTRRCIESLRAAREDAYPIEVIVVDNGSTDGSAEWLDAQGDIQLIKNPSNHGAPRARNQGIAKCRGDWVAFLDNDIVVPHGWLGRALYHGAVDPGVGAIPLVANRASKNQVAPYTGGDDDVSIARAAQARYHEFERQGADCALFTSLAVLVRREVIEQIGGFDERFSPWGFEDDDLSLRIHNSGWRNRVALDTFVYHMPYPDEGKHRRHQRFMRDNWEHFAAKWGPAGTTPKMFDYEALKLGTESSSSRECRVALPGPDDPPPTWSTEVFDVPLAEPIKCDDARPVGDDRGGAISAESLVPWPLSSRGRERFLAWPRYDRPDDIEQLLETWADVLIDHPDRCLCLRHDPEHDGNLSDAIERVQGIYSSVIGEGHELEVLLVDGQISEQDLPRLGCAVDGVIPIDAAGSDGSRMAWAEKLGARLFDDPAVFANKAGKSFTAQT